MAERAPARIAYRSKEAADLLGVSVKTLHALPIPWAPLGKGKKFPKRLYSRKALEAYLERHAA